MSEESEDGQPPAKLPKDNTKAMTCDEAIQYWRGYLRAHFNGPDEQIDAGIYAALRTMQTERSSQKVAQAALAACRRWKAAQQSQAQNERDKVVEQWYAWARQRFEGPPERIEAVVLAALDAMKLKSATSQQAAEAAIQAGQAWRPKQDDVPGAISDRPPPEAVSQWRAFLKANVNGPDAQIDAGISAAQVAMREGRSREQVAIAAFAACSRWRAAEEASDDQAAEAGARAAARWQDQSTPSAGKESSKLDFTTTSVAASVPTPKKVDVKQIALLSLSTVVLAYLFLLARSYNELLIQIGILSLLVYVWLRRSRGTFVATFSAALICDALFAVYHGVRPEHVLPFLLASGGALAWAWRGKSAAAASPRPGATSSPGNSNGQPAREFGNADRGFIAGLMYADAPTLIYGGRNPLYHTAQTVTFAVRRAGMGSNGRPLPPISVRWHGWKIEGALEEGDEVRFTEPPVEHRVNSPSVLYNLTRDSQVHMLPLSANPALKRAKLRYWSIIAVTVMAFFAIVAILSVH